MSADYAYGPTPPSPPEYTYASDTPNSPTPSPPKPTPIDPTCVNHLDLNLPSISGIIAGAMTYRRTLTAAFGKDHGAYGSQSAVQFKSTVAVDAGSSFDIHLSPTEFALSNGQEVTVLITITVKPDTTLDVPQTGWVRSRPPLTNQLTKHHLSVQLGLSLFSEL